MRRAETTVELGSGQSFALAGLLQHTSEQNISKVPWLGDIPILGQLFRSERFQRNETELVIIVTPYLVKPLQSTRLAAPTDGLRRAARCAACHSTPTSTARACPRRPAARSTPGGQGLDRSRSGSGWIEGGTMP